MKLLVFLVVLLTVFGQTLTKIPRVNQYVAEAQAAYAHKDFTLAIYYYTYLHDSLQVRDREIKLNLGHAYFQQKNVLKAFKYYQPLLTKAPPAISSLVSLQLGVLVAPDDKVHALDYFKKALVLNPMNEEARYNYELLKKYLALHPEEANNPLPPPNREQPKPEQRKKKETKTAGQKENPQGESEAEVPDFDNPDPARPPQPGAGKQDNQNPPPPAAGAGSGNNVNPQQPTDESVNKKQEEKAGTLPGTEKGLAGQEDNAHQPNPNRGGGREQSDEQDKNRQTTFERLRKAHISPEKARMLLETMHEAEVQYLQQIPRQRIRKIDPSKPNW